MEVISTFVSLMVEEPDASKSITSVRLERASPIDTDDTHQSGDRMVQVTHEPQIDNDDVCPGSSQGVLNQPQWTKPSDDTKKGTITEEAYRVVTSSMMADPIHQNNPTVALNMLETALTNRNVPLAKHYIDTLQDLIRKENALKTLLSVGKWVHASRANQHLNFEPSAPPLVENDDERNDNWMKERLNVLRQKAMLEIDKSGDHFLKQPEFSNLHYQDVLDIVTRDTLQVSSEKVVYCAIMKWADAECERKGLVTEDLNVKAVLNELIYATRYGLMSRKEFSTRTIEGHRGPDRIGIPNEINEKIVRYLSLKQKKRRPSEELPYKMSKERTTKAKRHSETKEKIIVNCLTCFSAVFD